MIFASGKTVLISTVSRVALGPNQPLGRWVLMVLSLAVKWLAHETDLLPLWSTKVNAWISISTPPYVFMVFIGTFYFTLL
jgi:hypothetical protein